MVCLWEYCWQETKQFGGRVYKVDGSILLTAGYPTPCTQLHVDALVHRGESLVRNALKDNELHGVQDVYQLVWSLELETPW